MSRRDEKIGFLTPESIPEERLCRSFSIPNETEWLGNFMGALYVLTQPENWRKYGALSPDEAAAEAQKIFDDGFFGTNDCRMVPAPFWDTAADIEFELSPDAQIWYGKAGSFAEDLQLWLFQGAIVLTFGLAGIKPAIRFATVYRNFLLQYKNDHAGAIIRFFIDSVQIFTRVDSGDGSISDVRVVGAAGLSSHELQIQADIGNGLSIVRKQLSPNELSDQNLRLNPDTGIVQHTTDGGVTWRDDPNQDPRTGQGQQFPARGGSDPRCDAAANMTAHMQALVNEFCSALNQLQLLNAWAAVLFIFMPEIWILLAPLEVVLAALLALGADFLCTFSSDEWNIVNEIIYCNIADDGSCSASQLATILAAIHARVSAPLYDFSYWIFQIIGNVGMTNAGATGDVVGDCSAFDCAWSYKWDFSIANGGWESQGFDDPAWNSEYSAGCCWRTASGSFATTKQIPACHILSVSISANASMAVATAATEHGTTFTHRCDGGACATLDWTVADGSWLSVFQVGGHELYSVTLHGDGSRPAFTGGAFI